MPLYTNPAEVEKIKAACKAAARVLAETCTKVAPGVTTKELNDYAAELMKKYDCRSGCLNYPPHTKKASPYPGHICVSVNDEIVHGIGSDKRVIKEGDIVSVDVVVEKDGYFGDNARTVAVGKIDPKTEKLLKDTEEALHLGIKQAHKGNTIGDIGGAIQSHIEKAGFTLIKNMVGHGVGREMHEEPQVPNYIAWGFSEKVLKVGMVLVKGTIDRLRFCKASSLI